MQKLSDKKITIIDRSGQTVSAPVKKGSFFGLFASRRDEAPRENTATLLKEPSLKSSSLNVPHANLSAVKNWIALEEKIVHDYKEQGTAPLKNAASLPEISTKQARPAFQTFSVQTGVSLSSSVPKLKASLRASERKSSKLGKFLMITGGLAAGALVFLYFQATFSNRETSQELAQLQSAKDQLSWSYAVLKNASENQSAEMKWMQGQYRDMASELRAAQAGKVSTEQSLEKKYREELMRITVRYESELAALRNTVETQQAIVNALKAQGRAFDKIIDQAGMSALSGAAAGLSRDSFSASGAGEITLVNGKQGSVVINVGADQGARSGGRITISRNGMELAIGRIDRVYPTMSVAAVRDAGMLKMIQEGDRVSFS